MEPKHDLKKTKGYEDRDANARGVAITGIALGVLILGSLWLAYGTIVFLAAQAEKQDKKLPPMFQAQVEVPEPRLQVTPVKDLKTIRAEEERILTTYDWVDPRAQIVRIPEQRALELTLQRGLPFRPKAAASAAGEKKA
jgi:hypothetical protein